MGLSALITTLRYTLMFLCLVVFGFDMYFVYIYIHHSDVVFTWEFYTETSLIGILFWVIFLSELLYRIGNCMKRRRQYEYDYAHHAPYLPPHLSSSHEHASPDTFPSNDTAVKTEDGVIIPYDRRSNSCHRKFWSVARLLFVWLMGAGLLNISIRSFEHQGRFVFTLPFARDSAQGDALNEIYSSYDPHNLFKCPDINLPDLLTTLCQFDQLTMTLSAAIGLVAIFEALFTIIFKNRRYSRPSEQRSHMKKRAEQYDEIEMGNAHIVVPIPPSHPLPQLNLHGIDNQNYLPVSDGTYEANERPLPPLPPQPEHEHELGDHYAAVGDTKKVGLNPFEKDLNDNKHVWDTDVGQESNAGPSNTYPTDVKRKDGL
ncbi:hypothetical protein BGZ80_008668 [Entomortierella chlamydospora]|uniref:Uncharacterized protein n=1 Tax=Entomortierella chlamydospora TaxID=101097 RepID=A0A9P6MXQ4_9FUNG|nr:hypothetical protein BGZ79_008101 [Entomortierella chlamydospora]KAG0017041.1 hypothetical protein BGZ80_008668 [Entomortierella chlamydospora]